MVVTIPQGVTVVDALPAEFEITQAANGSSYFVYEGTHYLPHVRSIGDEVYIVVDPPPQEAPPAEATTASGTARVERTMSVPGRHGGRRSIRRRAQLWYEPGRPALHGLSRDGPTSR